MRRKAPGARVVVGRLAGRGLLALAALVLAGSACRQDMHDQPKVEAYEASDFFADGRGGRLPVEGTVARGTLEEDEHLYTGKVSGTAVDEFPFPVTRDVLERGRQQFNIYCSPCHGTTAAGNGMIVQRGLKPPPSFHTDDLRGRAAGYYFDVITNGFGAMSDYRAQIAPRDRWAVVAYIRALQYSQRASIDDVPADRRGELDGPPPAAPAAAGEHGPGH